MSETVNKGAPVSLQERTLKVTNIHEQVSKELLEELFSQCGPVVNVVLKPDFAFIEFRHKESVGYSLALMEGVELFNQELILQPKLLDDPEVYKYTEEMNRYTVTIMLSPLMWWNHFGNKNQPMPRHICSQVKNVLKTKTPNSLLFSNSNQIEMRLRHDNFESNLIEDVNRRRDHDPHKRNRREDNYSTRNDYNMSYFSQTHLYDNESQNSTDSRGKDFTHARDNSIFYNNHHNNHNLHKQERRQSRNGERRYSHYNVHSSDTYNDRCNYRQLNTRYNPHNRRN